MAPVEDPTRQEEAADPSFEVNAEVLQQLMSGGNTELVGALQKALGKMVGTSSGYIESLPEPIQNRIEYLREIDEKRSDLEDEFEEKMKALEDEYTALYAPLDKELREIVAGTKDVPANEGEKKDDEETVPAGIPDFWLTALRNEPHLEELITDRDAEILAYLTNIDEEAVEAEEESFKLVFHFAENPFFSNRTLTKTYHMEDDDEDTVRHIEGDTINWKSSSKNVTVKVMKKKGKAKGSTPQTKLVPTESFFTWFTAPSFPDPDDELDEEEMEALQGDVENDYEVAEILRDDLLEHPVQWFTGEALIDEEEYDDEGEYDDEEDDEEDQDEDGTDDDDEDDDDGDEPPRRRPARGALDARAKPQECNQQ